MGKYMKSSEMNQDLDNLLLILTLLTSHPANIHSSMNCAHPGVWHACSNIVIDESVSNFSTSVGECNTRRNESISRRDKALARLCGNRNRNLLINQ